MPLLQVPKLVHHCPRSSLVSVFLHPLLVIWVLQIHFCKNLALATVGITLFTHMELHASFSPVIQNLPQILSKFSLAQNSDSNWYCTHGAPCKFPPCNLKSALNTFKILSGPAFLFQLVLQHAVIPIFIWE